MVLAIIGIATIVAMPSLVKSIRGNRLRVGARTIVMAGNYARTMAILRNQNMKLVLDKTAGSVTVESAREELPSPEPTDLQKPDGSQPFPPAPGTSEPEAGSTARASPPLRLVRQLDAVRIDSVEIDHQRPKGQDGTCEIIYQGNGRCNPYEVRVVDEFGSTMVVTVDAVASAKVRKEGD